MNAVVNMTVRNEPRQTECISSSLLSGTTTNSDVKCLRPQYGKTGHYMSWADCALTVRKAEI